MSIDKINYQGQSQVIRRIVNAINDLIDGGGGGGGHTIVDPSGTSMTQRDGLQFLDAHLADDSVNDRTKVEVVKETTEVAFDALDETDVDNDGFYAFEISGGTVIDASQVAYGSGTVDDALTKESFSVTADGTKTYRQVLNGMFADTDFSKLTPWSVFKYQAQIYRIADISTNNSRCIFIRNYFDAVSGKSQDWQIEMTASTSKLVQQNGDNVIVDYSSYPPNVGDVFTLYY